jgi:hypothetical protein
LLAQLTLLIVEDFIQIILLFLSNAILLEDILKLFAGVTENDYCCCNLLAEFVQLLITLLNFFIESLVFNLQLLKIYEMETIS